MTLFNWLTDKTCVFCQEIITFFELFLNVYDIIMKYKTQKAMNTITLSIFVLLKCNGNMICDA